MSETLVPDFDGTAAQALSIYEEIQLAKENLMINQELAFMGAELAEHDLTLSLLTGEDPSPMVFLAGSALNEAGESLTHVHASLMASELTVMMIIHSAVNPQHV